MGLDKGPNSIYETSRYILPAQSEALLSQRINSRKERRPELDEQLVQDISRAITLSIFGDVPVKVNVFDEWGSRVLEGKVSRIFKDTRQILLIQTDGAAKIIALMDILDMQIGK